jgi:hypothetical protein
MTLVKDCFDDPRINMSVSPRESRLILLAMNTYNQLLKDGECLLTEESQERWYEVLDYVQEVALVHGR